MPRGQPSRDAPACRSCGRRRTTEVLDLGSHPEASSFPSADELDEEPRWPLRAFICERCWLLQLDDAGPAEAFVPGPPPYELSETMSAHAESFVADVLARVPSVGARSQVVELASHGAYLQPFLADRGIRSLIVEGHPALAAAAAARGYPVVAKPFGIRTARDLLVGQGVADLVIDNYLLAHVPEPEDFVAAMALLVRFGGVAVLELDHMLPLLLDRRFDSIRHGHYSYFGLGAAIDLLARHGLRVFDATTQPVYGGALRIFVAHADDPAHPTSPAVGDILESERRAGLARPEAYASFARGVTEVRTGLAEFLEARRRAKEVVVGYGAPSRGNTLLNAVGVTRDTLPYTVDRSPLKHGRYLPGTHVPIFEPQRIHETRPDYVLILTWDIRHEVVAQMRDIATWGGRFVVPLPRLEVLR